MTTLQPQTLYTPSLPQKHARHSHTDQYADWIVADLQTVLSHARTAQVAAEVAPLLCTLYEYLEYHLGWRDEVLHPAPLHMGKLLRPRLLLLACEFASGQAGVDARARQRLARRALPAASSVELLHSFTLIHDDIEDHDEMRRNRLALWKLLGVPQAINMGDILCSLARSSMWRIDGHDIPATTLTRLGYLFDATLLALCEGQFLDISAEGAVKTASATYLTMIERKTAALMACAAEMGACLATTGDDALCAQLGAFGRALGIAFQIRDDLLGIWGAGTLGKPAYGDLRRKKMTLPVMYAIESSDGADRELLRAVYSSDEQPTPDQLRELVRVLEVTHARECALEALAHARQRAQDALAALPIASPLAREPQQQLGAVLVAATAIHI